ncbi:hypothetical protein, partial [Flavobacterium psychrophilum]|uniref:hypothetical protein n=1 Tax=Flavobacterium psychrophilum TaxID=96345 RepID=UPI001C52749E
QKAQIIKSKPNFLTYTLCGIVSDYFSVFLFLINVRIILSWNEKYYQVIHIMRFFVFRNGQYTPQILPLFLPKTGIY